MACSFGPLGYRDMICHTPLGKQEERRTADGGQPPFVVLRSTCVGLGATCDRRTPNDEPNDARRTKNHERFYSARSASIGSTRAARCAGSSPAMAASVTIK